MKIYTLIFANPASVSQTTATDLRFLEEAAARRGHELKVLYSLTCQARFTPSPRVLIEGKYRRFQSLLVRPNFLHSNAELHSALIRQFELSGVRAVNSADSIQVAKNKFEMFQKLHRARIPTPRTYIVRTARRVDNVVNDLGSYPLILKTIAGSHGAGVSIVESRRGLRSVVEMFLEQGKASYVMLQEYIRESKGKDVRAFVVGDRVVAAMERSSGERGEFRSNFKLGGKVKGVKLKKREQRIAIEAAQACGLEIAGVDILRSEDGPLVLEVNANPGIEGITKATEADVAGEVIDYFLSVVAAQKSSKKKRTSPKQNKYKKT